MDKSISKDELISKEKAAEIIEQAKKEMIAGSKNGLFDAVVRSVCGIIKCKIMLYKPEQPES